jgi:hypothetical protein
LVVGEIDILRDNKSKVLVTEREIDVWWIEEVSSSCERKGGVPGSREDNNQMTE